MKAGDLVKVPLCSDEHINCGCFFCSGNSNGVGVVLAPAKLNMWHVMFDIGEWELRDDECEVLNEIR